MVYNTMSPQAGQEVKQTGFGSSICELNHQVELLTERLGVMYSRIEPLLNPQQKAVNPNQKQPTCPKPTAIIEIDSVSEKLEQIRITLDECIARLEI